MVTLNKIYTRKGDSGETAIVSVGKVRKTCARIEAIGTVDELNAAIGVASAQFLPGMEYDFPQIFEDLPYIQNQLFDLGADLATPDPEMNSALRLSADKIDWLEDQIDRMNGKMEALQSFILPAGSPLSANLHMARAICRRAERVVWHCIESGEEISPAIATYLNRLSDYLFVAARYVGINDESETLWEPGV